MKVGQPKLHLIQLTSFFEGSSLLSRCLRQEATELSDSLLELVRFTELSLENLLEPVLSLAELARVSV